MDAIAPVRNPSKSLTAFTFKTPDRLSERWGAAGYLKHDIRVVTIDGEPWFVAADVCRALGVALRDNGGVNTSAALSKLDADEKRNLVYVEAKRIGLHHDASRAYGISIVSESGLYKLVMRSDKSEAKVFQNWVTKDVLPAIRKDGAYVMGEEKMKTGEMSEDEFVLRAVSILQAKVERYRDENARLSDENTAVRTVIGANQHDLERFCRTLEGVNITKVKLSLERLGYLYMKAGVYRVYRKHSNFFEEKINDYTGKVSIFPTEAGKVLLTRLNQERRLVRKQGY